MKSIALAASAAGHSAPITGVATSPYGSLVATASYDGTVLVWNFAEPHNPQLGARLSHRRLANSAAWSREHEGLLATSSADKTAAIWRIETDGSRATPVGRLAHHTDDVNATVWLPDGDRVVTASEDSTALIWDWRSGRVLGRVAAHEGHCMAIAVAPNGLILSVGEDGSVFAVDPDMPGHGRHRSFGTSIEGCAFAPDGSRAALACDDGTVRIVSPELDLLESISGATSACRSVVFAADGSGRLVVGSYDATVRVVRGTATEVTARGGRLWPRSLDLVGDHVVVGSFGARPVVLALEDLEVVGDGGPDTYGPNAIASNGVDVAVALDCGLVVTLPRSSIASAMISSATAFQASHDPVLSVAPTNDGWVIGTYGGLVRHMSTEGDRVRLVAEVDLSAPVPSLATSDNHEQAVAGTYDGVVHRFEVGSGLRKVSSHAVHRGSVKSVAWFDDEIVISGSTDGSVGRLDRDGTFAILWFHGNLVNAVSLDRRGIIASASRDHLVKVSSSISPPVLAADLLGADESMKAVCVLGVGNDAWILGGSYDFGLYAWHYGVDGDPPDARAGHAVFFADQAISAILAIDPVTAVVASWDGSIRLCSLGSNGIEAGPPVYTNDIVTAARNVGRSFAEEVPVRAT